MPPQRQHDPSLPRPWELLFDPASGLKYYWNPTTNVTQYEAACWWPYSHQFCLPPGGAAPYVSLPAEMPFPWIGMWSTALCPLSFVVSGLNTSRWICRQAQMGMQQTVLCPTQNGHTNGNAAHVLPSGQQNFTMSCAAYRAEHGLVVQGDSVPEPLQTFEGRGASQATSWTRYLRQTESCMAALLARWQGAGAGCLTQPVGIEAMARFPATEERTVLVNESLNTSASWELRRSGEPPLHRCCWKQLPHHSHADTIGSPWRPYGGTRGAVQITRTPVKAQHLVSQES